MRRLVPISLIMLGLCWNGGSGGSPDSRLAVSAKSAVQVPEDGAGAARVDRLTSYGFPREW